MKLLLLLSITASLDNFCDAFNKKIKAYYWGQVVCRPSTWEYNDEYITPGGHSLPFKVVDFPPVKSVTLVMCGIHGDELPSPFICIHLIRDMLFDNPSLYKNARIIVAPLVNPDSFFKDKPTRTNGRGVDINRNFPTSDFEEKAISEWKSKYRSDKRKYPGDGPASEIETKFQIMLINKYKPNKIISVHSPLGWLDVDSPMEVGDDGSGVPFHLIDESKNVADLMSKHSNDYPVKNFLTYPGSLGKYAALENNIPTYTLELPTSDSHLAYKYWKLVHKGLISAINYEMTPLEKKKKDTEKN